MSLGLADLVLETPRLRLRPVGLDDVDAIFAQFTPDVTRYMYPASPKHRGETELFVRESLLALADGRAYRASVRLQDGGALVGMVGLEDLETELPAYGVWIGADHQGHGYGREAVLALHRWACAHVPQRVAVYPVDRDNAPSRRIAEALGGRIAREHAQWSLGGKTLHLLDYHVPLGA